MAEHKQSGEFLGGGPKFSPVGLDTRSEGSAEEPLVPINQTGYWLRVGVIGLVLLVLAVTLFVLNDRSLGKTTLPPTRLGGHTISPNSKDAPLPPNLQ